MIRPATVADVPEMARLVNDAAEYGLMLHRSLESLYERVRDHVVAVDDDGRVVGVCGLRVMWANFAEVYALAVSPTQRGRGLGSQLVERCLDEARRLGVRQVMSLTYEQRFFERLGFEVVDRMSLPMKVWAECARCSKQEACDEIAMVRVLAEVLTAEAPAPPGGTGEAAPYAVPVVMRVSSGAGTRKKMDEMP